ncbi:acyl-CoA dehydrogenase family protein [Nocardia sp. NPDC059239]|uniref:acyl-CoA dehydrogenase family protein n=1 Tax=Nocardia sp. NPDC059239 TaxID=3346785 RepID=UPI00368061A7
MIDEVSISSEPLELPSEAVEFRDRLCAFLHKALPQSERDAGRDRGEVAGWSAERHRAFKRELGRRGFIGTTWPREYGGREMPAVFDLILAEEMEYHDAPAGSGVDSSVVYLPQLLIQHGSQELKAAHLPRLLLGEETVFLGYSEPEAGTDLASLKTSAQRQDDVYIVNGQKSYSSFAHIADYCLLAARTGSDRYNGISLFWVDMTSPGITVSFDNTITGARHPAVRFDDVRVPEAALVGTENDGWRTLMGAIDHERSALASAGLVESHLRRLIATTRRVQEASSQSEPMPHRLWDKTLDLTLAALSAKLLNVEIAAQRQRGEVAPAFPTMAQFLKRSTVRNLEIAGHHRTSLRGDEHFRTSNECWPTVTYDLREHAYFTFAAGGFDIAHEIIARRALGVRANTKDEKR